MAAHDHTDGYIHTAIRAAAYLIRLFAQIICEQLLGSEVFSIGDGRVEFPVAPAESEHMFGTHDAFILT